MIPYADTNFFTRLYLEMPESAGVADLVANAREVGMPPLPITSLHRMELCNALQLHVFQGRAPGRLRVTAEQANAAIATFREDLAAAHFFREVVLTAGALEAQFEELSLRHTAHRGFRTYDILHVSSALLLGCDTFWSFDTKACNLARLEGLHCSQ